MPRYRVRHAAKTVSSDEELGPFLTDGWIDTETESTATPTPKTSNRAGAIANSTKAVFRAVGAVLYGENRKQLPRDAGALARLLADRAQELALGGCDDLKPESKLVNEAVRAVLEGMAAVDIADASPPPRGRSGKPTTR